MGTLLWKELLFLNDSAQPIVFALVADKLGQLPKPVRKGERREGALNWKQGRTRTTQSLSSWRALFFLSFSFEGHFWATLALSHLQAFPDSIGTQGCLQVKDLATGCIIRPLDLRPFPPILCQCSLFLQGSLESSNLHAHSWATRSRVSK